MKYIHNDGGRKAAGFNGEARDCAVRAIAIAAELPYRKVYEDLSEAMADRDIGKRTPRTGTSTTAARAYMVKLGWRWVPTMGIGTGCKVHLRDGELPMGRLVVRVSRHFVAVIDGVIHDAFDPSRDGSRCVYGYWTKEVSQS